MTEMILAVPQIRGKSDIVENYEPAEAIEAGFAVSLDNNGKIKKFDGTGSILGVSGYVELGNKVQGVFRSSIDLVVRVNSDVTVNLNQNVYVTSSGLFTNIADGNTAVAARFKSAVGKALDIQTRAEVENCAKIEFLGGL